jgi:hypothetical protein
VKLRPKTVELLRWLDARSGAAHEWVNVDERPQTRGAQIQCLVDAGLAELMPRVGLAPRYMRITSLGRATVPSERQPGEDPTPQNDAAPWGRGLRSALAGRPKAAVSTVVGGTRLKLLRAEGQGNLIGAVGGFCHGFLALLGWTLVQLDAKLQAPQKDVGEQSA